jgi:putative transposase
MNAPSWWNGQDHFWSASYFAGSCGGPPLAIIKEYIDNQKRPT